MSTFQSDEDVMADMIVRMMHEERDKLAASDDFTVVKCKPRRTSKKDNAQIVDEFTMNLTHESGGSDLLKLGKIASHNKGFIICYINAGRLMEIAASDAGLVCKMVKALMTAWEETYHIGLLIRMYVSYDMMKNGKYE